MQHESLALLKEMLYALDLALYVGTSADKKAADRLQRRYLPQNFACHTGPHVFNSYILVKTVLTNAAAVWSSQKYKIWAR